MKPNRGMLALEHKKKVLPEIMAEAQEITQAIVEAGGELTPELEMRLQLNKTQLALKVDSYIFIDDQLQSQALFFAERAKAYQKVSKAFSMMSDRLMDRVKQVMVESDTKELKGDEYRFVLASCAQRLVIEEKNIPKEFLMQVTTTIVDKDRIKSTLKDGFEVPGAALEGGVALRHYLNSSED